ncbi:hypothetical protein CDD80_5736 [Ophiocordyceps camponoti-rufipedis]|uniref:Uncharacterized protein n=1 Tax=Ophiocordyceps camponoti-rufipedis TaxID=2004952 RepID=A0A2C5XY29_9HYPO|nr:hypothetical protein CDD80_5736 [Ophiocordyceps camponoti-rufipedis]
MYGCPQVFCYDGETLLLLQFRAENEFTGEDEPEMGRADCPVDCWVLSRHEDSAPMRRGLYNLLVQGIRRYQGSIPRERIIVGDHQPCRRRWFDGRSLWLKADGSRGVQHPGGRESDEVIWQHGRSSVPEKETKRMWGRIYRPICDRFDWHLHQCMGAPVHKKPRRWKTDVYHSYGQSFFAFLHLAAWIRIENALAPSCRNRLSNSEDLIWALRALHKYAIKYKCPQVFAFDGETLIVLQIRAMEPKQLKKANCPIDCWVLQRSRGGATFREALYKLIVQGTRRHQGTLARPRALIGSQTPYGPDPQALTRTICHSRFPAPSEDLAVHRVVHLQRGQGGSTMRQALYKLIVHSVATRAPLSGLGLSLGVMFRAVDNGSTGSLFGGKLANLGASGPPEGFERDVEEKTGRVYWRKAGGPSRKYETRPL